MLTQNVGLEIGYCCESLPTVATGKPRKKAVKFSTILL
jgi:hypothetical protein